MSQADSHFISESTYIVRSRTVVGLVRGGA